MYNKKNFWQGIFFLIVTIVSIPLTIANSNQYTIWRLSKHILIDAFAMLLGVTLVYRSLNKLSSDKDKQNNDERKKLITMKSRNSAFNITLVVSITMAILSGILFGITKHEGWASIFVGISVVFTIMIISEISSYFYHEKRN